MTNKLITVTQPYLLPLEETATGSVLTFQQTLAQNGWYFRVRYMTVSRAVRKFEKG